MKKFFWIIVLLVSVNSFCQNEKHKGYYSICKNPIKITKVSGTYEVIVNLNKEIKVPFVFDTGASECVMPVYIAMTLYRNGSLKKADFLQDKVYSLADGSSVRCKRIIIRKLIIGKYVLTNVEFAVSNNIDAPLLLGQNAMRKLGDFTIDYKKSIICVN